MQFPMPADIFAARHALGLTQTQAAFLVHTTFRTWQRWEAGDRKMPLSAWELFCIKTGLKFSPK